MKVISGVLFFVFFSVCAFAQDRGIIECQDQTIITAWDAPGSLMVIRQIPCGQTVTIVGLERGYVKIQIKENVFGYIEAKYVRSLQSASDVNRRVAELEAQIKTLQERSAAADKQSLGESTRSVAPTHQGFPRSSSQPEELSEPINQRFDVAGMFAYIRSFEPGAGRNFYGWNGSIGGNFTKHFGIEANFGGSYLNTGTNLFGASVYTLLGGPRIVFPGHRVTPIVHFLAGLGHGRGELLGIGASTNGFALVPGFGLDVNINRHLAVRAVQFDYMLLHADSNWYARNIRIGGGLVARF